MARDDASRTHDVSRPGEATGDGPRARGTPLRSLALRGSFWVFMGFGANQVVRLAGNLILAQMLVPEMFGLVGLVHVFIQGLGMFSDVGINRIIIQSKRGEDPAFLNTVWTIQIARGVLLWSIACALAWPLSRFYEEPRLFWLIPAVGLNALISGFDSTRVFSCNRQLMMGRLTSLELLGQILATTVMIVWAWYHPTAWALVAGGVTLCAVRMTLSYLVLPGERNRLHWDPSAWTEIFSFGKWIFLSSVITFFAGQIDRLMLGKLEAFAVLGVYQIAMVVTTLPTVLIMKLADTVLYPVLAEKARTEADQLADRLIQARGVLLPACLFIVVGMVLGAPVFFNELYREDYAAAGWIAQLVAISSWFMILKVSTGLALLAVGDSRSMMVSNVFNLVGTTAGCYLGFVYFGLPGFIIGLGVGTLAGHLVVQFGLARHGIHIFRQDVQYTAFFAAVGLGSVFGARYLGKRLFGAAEDVGVLELAGGAEALADSMLFQLAVAAIVLLPLAGWSAQRLYTRLVRS